MSPFDNVVGGKLKLKGKALDVKSGGVKKKKKKSKSLESNQTVSETQKSLSETDAPASNAVPTNETENSVFETQHPSYEDHRTAAEKRYDEQREKLDSKKLAELAKKSHRQRIEEFNQYLANLSEHYDIPKVGPG